MKGGVRKVCEIGEKKNEGSIFLALVFEMKECVNKKKGAQILPFIVIRVNTPQLSD